MSRQPSETIDQTHVKINRSASLPAEDRTGYVHNTSHMIHCCGNPLTYSTAQEWLVKSFATDDKVKPVVCSGRNIHNGGLFEDELHEYTARWNNIINISMMYNSKLTLLFATRILMYE
jgi:hypothetical protein